jgi:hypothetical protein
MRKPRRSPSAAFKTRGAGSDPWEKTAAEMEAHHEVHPTQGYFHNPDHALSITSCDRPIQWRLAWPSRSDRLCWQLRAR